MFIYLNNQQYVPMFDNINAYTEPYEAQIPTLIGSLQWWLFQREKEFLACGFIEWKKKNTLRTLLNGNGREKKYTENFNPLD
jgi:hypothetical protein